MGLYLNTYLGPYVQADYRIAPVEVEVTGCLNGKCGEHAKATAWGKPAGKFCSACASPIGKFKRIENRRASIYDVLGESEELTQISYEDAKNVCLGSNIKGPRDFHPKEECHIDLSGVDQAAEMRWFEDRFAGDIAKVRAAYDNVKILWGLHMFKR